MVDKNESIPGWSELPPNHIAFAYKCYQCGYVAYAAIDIVDQADQIIICHGCNNHVPVVVGGDGYRLRER